MIFHKILYKKKTLDRYIFIMSLLILALMISTLIWWVAHVYKFMMFFSVKSQSCDIKAYISWWFLARLEVKINTNSFNTSPRNNIKASLFEKCKIILFILNRCVMFWGGWINIWYNIFFLNKSSFIQGFFHPEIFFWYSDYALWLIINEIGEKVLLDTLK